MSDQDTAQAPAPTKTKAPRVPKVPKVPRLTAKMLDPLQDQELRGVALNVMAALPASQWKVSGVERRRWVVDHQDLLRDANDAAIDSVATRDPAVTAYLKSMRDYLRGGPPPTFGGVQVAEGEFSPVVQGPPAVWERQDSGNPDREDAEETEDDEDDTDDENDTDDHASDSKALPPDETSPGTEPDQETQDMAVQFKRGSIGQGAATPAPTPAPTAQAAAPAAPAPAQKQAPAPAAQKAPEQKAAPGKQPAQAAPSQDDGGLHAGLQTLLDAIAGLAAGHKTTAEAVIALAHEMPPFTAETKSALDALATDVAEFSRRLDLVENAMTFIINQAFVVPPDAIGSLADVPKPGE